MNTPEKIDYTAKAKVTGGRSGHGATDDNVLEVDLRAPKKRWVGPVARRTRSSFAIGYGACFQGAMGLAGKELDVDTSDSTVHSEVGIGKEGESFGLSVKTLREHPGCRQRDGSRRSPTALTSSAHIRRQPGATSQLRLSPSDHCRDRSAPVARQRVQSDITIANGSFWIANLRGDPGHGDLTHQSP